MKKKHRLKLLINDINQTSIRHPLLYELIKPCFDIVIWQEGVNYSRNDHVLLINALTSFNPSYWYRPYLNDSYKIIIDNNIELCENISNILAIFSNADYKLLNQMDSGYMKSLIYDLIESIRIYKIGCLMQD